MSARAVLIVDDSEDYRRILSRIVSAGGYKPLLAKSAEEARLVLKAGPPPAAVLLDWNMPGDSGIDLAREIRGDPALARLPLLMLSVNAEPADQARGLEEGRLNGYMVKPVSPDELLARLQVLLARVAS